MTEAVDLFGIPLRAFTPEGFLEWVIAAAKNPEPQTCYGINVHSVNTALATPDYYAALQRCPAVYCDGFGVYLACKILGQPIPARLCTTDYVFPICEALGREGMSIYILGNPPGVAERAAQILQEHSPGLVVKGTHSGYFDAEEEAQIITEIRELKPDLLWVGMGNPVQELWVEKHREALNVPVTLTCGAMMECVSGALKRPPAWMCDHGLEWLYRLLTQTSRTWRRYLIGNPLFLWRVMRARFLGWAPSS